MPRRPVEPEPVALEEEGPEVAEPRIMQIMPAAPVVGGDNTVAHGTGRTTVQAWAVLEDGTVAPLVRQGDALVVAAVAEPVEEEAPTGPVDTPTAVEDEAPAENEPSEPPVEEEPAEA